MAEIYAHGAKRSLNLPVQIEFSLALYRLLDPAAHPMRILLVEDDRELAEAVARALKTENFVVDLALNGEDGQHFGDTEPYDAAVLDLGLPKVTGVAVLKAWRAAGRGLPVLILSARDGWSDKVEGFKASADDYLVKPFRMEELVMRLRALIRRAARHASPQIVSGPLTFDAQLGSFMLNGMPLRLTALEWRVLSCLAFPRSRIPLRSRRRRRAERGRSARRRVPRAPLSCSVAQFADDVDQGAQPGGNMAPSCEIERQAGIWQRPVRQHDLQSSGGDMLCG